ncbi:MAG: septum formation protein Maf [Anaerolineales bacterium]|nr:MAG: septum formation protein Maf [Anaerolineales bacterium]
MNIHLYLASNSPRRKELISLVKWEYNHLPVEVDENPLPGEGGSDYVARIANAKAQSARHLARGNSLVIAADTAVLGSGTDGKMVIYGKPKDAQDAKDMLRALRGRSHQVMTAVTVLRTQDGMLVSDRCTTDVPMRAYGDAEIEAYVSGGDPLDKAGAYAIQHAGFHPVENLAGCYANVMGLPLCHLARALKKFNVRPQLDVPSACQAGLGYNCHVYHEILSEGNQERLPA